MLQFDIRVTVNELKDKKRETEFDYNVIDEILLEELLESKLDEVFVSVGYRTFFFTLAKLEQVK